MVKFDDNEFEIAITTYNRPLFIEKWLEHCYEEVIKRNIELKIYDSSTDSETEKVVSSFNQEKHSSIKYYHVDSCTNIGYKPMVAILNSECKYVWVCGDSRYNDFSEFDQKGFPKLKQGIEFLVFFNDFGTELEDTDYVDKTAFLHDCFIPCTCIGCSIYKTAIFSNIKNSSVLKTHYDKLFADNYGFAWLGYFYSVFADNPEYRAAYRNVKIHNIFNKKKQLWAMRFYGCWIDDLCQIMDNLPSVYKNTETVCMETWERMKLYSYHYCFLSKLGGDLNKENYRRYVDTGLIKRIPQDKLGRIKFFAYSPKWIIRFFFLCFRCLHFSKRIIRKILK